MAAAGPEGGPSADELIANLDEDGDGTLSEAEFAAGAPQGGNAPPPSAGGVASTTSSDDSDEVFDSLDTNEDGFVSQAEWAAGMASASSETDTSTDDLFATLLQNLQSTSSSDDKSSQAGSATSKVAELMAAIQSYMKFDTTGYSLADTRSLFSSDLYA
jgi:hypothetical protein